MIKYLSSVFVFILSLFLVGCDEEEKIDHTNSIEFYVRSKVTPDNKYVIVETKRQVFFGGKIIKDSVISLDSLPGLGMEKAKTDDGNDTSLAKQYNIIMATN